MAHSVEAGRYFGKKRTSQQDEGSGTLSDCSDGRGPERSGAGAARQQVQLCEQEAHHGELQHLLSRAQEGLRHPHARPLEQ